MIARDNVPLVRLVPVGAAPRKRQFGAYPELGPLPDSFFEPLLADEIEAWEGR